ncbi:MAG TPA: phosphoglycerate kinase, partial [Chloroflexota bacterium]|nr:phosphoglycerate kinase [Chloroflexota bacterium]
MRKKTIRDVDLRGKRVLVRVDFNVPLEGERITDDTRIRAALPTIRSLIEQGAKVVLMSHLGRPDGKVVEGLRLAPVARHLQSLLGQPVAMAPDCTGPQVEAAVQALPAGGVLLLENLRFHPEEEANDPQFARELAALADVYVNDAFGTAHRAHASTEGVAHHLPSDAGLLLEREVTTLQGLIEDPARPLVVVLGGAKVTDKVALIDRFLDQADALLIGGAMCFSFFRAQGLGTGDSLVDEE